MTRVALFALLVLAAAGCDSTDDSATVALRAEAGEITYVPTPGIPAPAVASVPLTLQNAGTATLDQINVRVLTRSTTGSGGSGDVLFGGLAPGASVVFYVAVPGYGEPGFVCYSYSITYLATSSNGTRVAAGAPTTGGTCPS